MTAGLDREDGRGALPDFLGYRRPDGSVGVRNHVLVLCINGLALRASERIASALHGAMLAATPTGRGHVEPDLTLQIDQLAGLGANPNVAAALIVGVDAATTKLVRDRIAATGKPVASVCLADCHEDALALIDAGVRLGAHLVREASQLRRELLPLDRLVVAVECGHSDATSGIASNPVVGAAVDLLVAGGATVVLGETVEWLGAEHVLARRARSGAVADHIARAVAGRERLAIESGHSLTGNNPGEENIRGGLSTIEEKSLGAIAKSGTATIEAVIDVAAPLPGRGLYLMDGPSFSPESMTGFVASGAHIILFTTGPGNNGASLIAPTIKVTAHGATAARLKEQIDFDASGVFDGEETTAAAGGRLLGFIGEIAGGTLTFGEVLGEGLEVLTRARGSL